MDVEMQERVFPWTHPEVLEFHKQFDAEFAQTRSSEDGEALFSRFFSPAGLLEQKVKEWQSKDVDHEEVLRLAFELYSFKAFVFTCFFFNGYPDEIVKEWWDHPGMRSWASDDAFLQPAVKKIQRAFAKEIEQCETMLDLEAIREKYQSPAGVVFQELRKLSTMDQKKQVAVGAEFFSLKSLIDYTLFATEFSTKVDAWTVPAVRKLVYEFEHDLKSAQTEEAFRALEGQYIGENGLVGMELKQLKVKDDATKHTEELIRFQEAVRKFFSENLPSRQ